MLKICPCPANARSPRPVISELPQYATDNRALMLGLIERLDPVQASRAFRWASFQSDVPSSCRIANEVRGDFVVIRALTGVVEVIFWYRKGMPTNARRIGDRMRRLEIVLSGVPERPTREPRLV